MNEFGTLHLKDERFDPAQSGEMQLLIKIATGRISYAIVNEREGRLQLLFDSPVSTDIQTALDDLLDENPYLRSSFSSTKISIDSSRFAFIPTQYYTPDDLQGYKTLIEAADDTKIILNTINNEGINCISGLPIAVTDLLGREFPAARFFCQAEPLIEGASKGDSSHPAKLFLQFNEQTFEAYLSKEDKLVYYNVFSIENADDFNYFLLNLLEQFNLESQSTIIVVSGRINQGDANYRRIEKYFKNIELADSSTLTLFTPAFEQLPKHHHFSLISLLLCE